MHYRWDDDDLLIQLRISPRASRDQVGAVMGNRIKISITAPPVDGKANKHLVKWLAKRFGVSQSQVEIESGLSSRDKSLRIHSPAKLPDGFEIEEKKGQDEVR